MTTIRVISNGHGEDAIATTLMRAMPGATFDVYPLVGHGHAYRGMGIEPCMVQSEYPSGGFLLTVGDIIKDIRAGALVQLYRQRRALRHPTADMQWVVGDVFALWLARCNMPTVFLPSAKSERAIPHTRMERLAIRAMAQMVFPRDHDTHTHFLDHGLPSMFFGNPMFDHLSCSAPPPSQRVVALFPGSRREALGNLRMMLTLLPQLNLDIPHGFMMARSLSLSVADLHHALGDTLWELSSDATVMRYTRAPIVVDISTQFNDVLHQSTAVIGLAGTANEQAMFANRLLISFIGMGPQSTRRRFLQQHRLIAGADARLIESQDPMVMAQEVSAILNQHNRPWQPVPHQDAASDIVRAIQKKWLK